MKDHTIHGVYSLSNCAALQIHIDDHGIETAVYYKLVIIDGMKPQKWYKAKVYYNTKGAYFKFGNSRIYLDQVLRV